MQIRCRAVVCRVALSSSRAVGQTTYTVSRHWASGSPTVEKNWVGAADAMPDEQYSFRPTSGGEKKNVFHRRRTFGETIKPLGGKKISHGANILAQKPTSRSGSGGPEPDDSDQRAQS